MNLLGEVDL